MPKIHTRSVCVYSENHKGITTCLNRQSGDLYWSLLEESTRVVLGVGSKPYGRAHEALADAYAKEQEILSGQGYVYNVRVSGKDSPDSYIVEGCKDDDAALQPLRDNPGVKDIDVYIAGTEDDGTRVLCVQVKMCQ